MAKAAKVENAPASIMVKVPCPCIYHVYDERWVFNGNFDSPTFGPVEQGGAYSYLSTRKDYRCHSYVRDGHVEYCDDCTHEFAKQRLALEDIP